MEYCEFQSVKYLLSCPDGSDTHKKYPLVIFLHGAGTRSDELSKLVSNGNFKALNRHRNEKDYVLLAPLCSVTNWNEVMPTLIALVDDIRHRDYIDITRVYLTGNSMGGYGTWELASLRPDWFASAMPVCGGGMGWMAGTLVDVPIRTFHGMIDTVVEPNESLAMARAVNLKGGHAEVILYPDLAHNCWDRVYGDISNIDWMMAFTTDRDKSVIEQLKGDYYG